MAGTSPKYQTPEVKPSPTSGGLGEGAEGRPSAGGAPTVRTVRKELEEVAVVGLPPKYAVRNILTALKKYGQVKAELLLYSTLVSGEERYVVVRFIISEAVVVDTLLTISEGRVVEVDYDVYEYKLPEMLRRTAALKEVLG